MGENANRTVTVACDLPHGLILRLHTSRQVTPPQGGREYTEYLPLAERVTINGLNSRETVRFGYAMTIVDAAFWDTWLSQNKAFPPVVMGHLFGFATSTDTVAKAREMEGLRTGFEPLDPDNLPPGIEKADAGGSAPAPRARRG